MWPWTRLLCCFLFLGYANGGFLQVISVTSLILKSIWNVWMITDAVPDYLCHDDKEVKGKLRTISNQLNTVESRLLASEDMILREIYNIPSEIKHEMKLNKLLDTVLQIERVEKIFEDYMEIGLKDQLNSKSGRKLENHTIMDFLDTIISHHPGSVRANMDTLHQMIVVDDSRTMFLRNGVFSSFLDYMKLDMAILKLLFLLILAYANGASRRNDISELVKTDRLRQEVLTRISELWEETGHPEWQYLARRKPGGLDGQLVTEFKILSEKIDKMKLPKISERIMETLWVWSVLNIEMSSIIGKWVTFRQSQARPDPLIYGDSWKAVAETTLHDSPSTSSVKNSLSSLQDMVWDNVEGHKDVFTIVNEEAEDHICEGEMSPQQLLYNLFSILQMSQLKAYTMINFSWLLLRLYNKGNFTTEADMLHTNYLERMSQQANALKESMKRADSAFWRCDPRIHEEGKTYTEVTKLLQGFLVNEVDLNNEATCREDCPFYKYTKQYTCFKDNYCAKQPRCNGNVVGCQFVDSDMWVCQAPSQSTRRYDWIRYENGRTLGSMGSCSRTIAKVDSWWRWLFWHCSFCICYCDDPKSHQSDRFFNLRAAISDKANNMVVTGIRFKKVNRIVHLQVQQGELLPMGGINETTIQWKPIDEYNIDDTGVTAGVDYHMLTWEGRAIDLDDIKVPHDCVVTGVKLRKVGGHLNLEVEGAQFNFTSGKLVQSGEKSFWSSNDKTDVSQVNPRTQLNLKRPDIPTKSAGSSHIDSKSEQFVEFGPTDLDLDAGQTTIPYLDIQDVAPQPPVPLAGIGIYHKGRDYSGGFIAPKVFTYDFSKHIIDHFPDNNEAN